MWTLSRLTKDVVFRYLYKEIKEIKIFVNEFVVFYKELKTISHLISFLTHLWLLFISKKSQSNAPGYDCHSLDS